jgi:hypothetical protein
VAMACNALLLYMRAMRTAMGLLFILRYRLGRVHPGTRRT